VAGTDFKGRAALTLDGKGRVSMPARYRELLQGLCGGQLVLTRNTEGALWVFPRPAWQTFEEKVVALPVSATRWKRLFLGTVSEVEIDASSRLMVSPELRAAAGLERDVMLVGMGDRFELWDVQRLAAAEATLDGEAMPEALANAVL
jgi:MraZ protein